MQNQTTVAKREREQRTAAQNRACSGIFNVLTQEHSNAIALLERLADTTDPKQRAELWPKLRSELLAHEHVEVDVLYSALLTLAETREVALGHEAEARDLEMMIERLSERAYDHPEWQASAATLLQLFLQHVNEEEATCFPLAEALLGPQRASELGSTYRAQKAQARSLSTRGNESFRVVP